MDRLIAGMIRTTTEDNASPDRPPSIPKPPLGEITPDAAAPLADAERAYGLLLSETIALREEVARTAPLVAAARAWCHTYAARELTPEESALMVAVAAWEDAAEAGRAGAQGDDPAPAATMALEVAVRELVYGAQVDWDELVMDVRMALEALDKARGVLARD